MESSSKYYTESEYDEDGKVVADYDSTGENKTKYSYTNDVINEKEYANGSKFAYGRDLDDTVTSISQSTEEGEENATNQILKNGLVIEVNSGNNKIQYGYDYKRRLKTVKYNGKADYAKYDYTENDSYDEIVTTNANNETLTVRKDKRGKVLSSIYGNGMKLLYAYDDKDKLTTVTEYNGETALRSFSYTYDSLDKILTYNESNGVSESYTYDSYGQVSSKTVSVGDNTTEYSYGYDENTAERKLSQISVGSMIVYPKYDANNRNKGKEIYFGSNEKLATERIEYRKVGDHATDMPSGIYFGDKQNGTYTEKTHLKYTYDELGNITKITEKGELVARYAYDKVNRLTREDNKAFGKTWLYTYDNNGNILSKRETEFTLKGNVEENTFTTDDYEYEGDQLLSYNNATFDYDNIGNPTTYRGNKATWLGRMLTGYNNHTFVYDARGRRIQKDTITYTYDSNGKLLKQSNGLEFFYDHTGIAGVVYNNTRYIYRKDVQGNIVGILDNTGKVVVKYTYDAWGNHGIEILDSSCETLGNLNPFRYRGYYYDTETELYFLKTRYYDPEIGRFMNIDGIEYLAPETVNGLNLYAYCGNNPVMGVDPNGTSWWSSFKKVVKNVAKVVGGAMLAVVGAAGAIGSLAISAIPGSGFVTQAALTTTTYGMAMIGSVFDSQIQADMDAIGWDPFNSDPNKIVGDPNIAGEYNSKKMSFYKGVPVFKYAGPDGSSGSFGVILLDRGSKSDTLNHERGHNVQFSLLGVLNYGLFVAIPSVIYNKTGDYRLEQDIGKADKMYYSKIWERTADWLGGVDRGNYFPFWDIENFKFW